MVPTYDLGVRMNVCGFRPPAARPLTSVTSSQPSLAKQDTDYDQIPVNPSSTTVSYVPDGRPPDRILLPTQLKLPPGPFIRAMLLLFSMCTANVKRPSSLLWSSSPLTPPTEQFAEQFRASSPDLRVFDHFMKDHQACTPQQTTPPWRRTFLETQILEA
ncbi:hypothetical protein FA13DRAFT_1796573 [Coprinellus micaceus]|uniref:Uncharacterized protein n=1 Tax=Coprinellus micaceus TaxID=71717 RepID=A0A4Y7SU32_COPMI|nr:hypothetical protein FA13DRAFT_1796573 [Coprinellus micaceus]